MEEITVKVFRINNTIELPKYAHDGDMGMDIKAIGYEYNAKLDLYIYHTGLIFEVPKGYGMFVFPRSSNTKTECYMPNSVGVLDSCYRGELTIRYKLRDGKATCWSVELLQDMITNKGNNISTIVDKYTSQSFTGIDKAPYKVGERIAQIVILPYPHVNFSPVEDIDELTITDRGAGGYGSTGK